MAKPIFMFGSRVRALVQRGEARWYSLGIYSDHGANGSIVSLVCIVTSLLYRVLMLWCRTRYNALKPTPPVANFNRMFDLSLKETRPDVFQ